MISTINQDILFDDCSLLEVALGKDALKVSAVNANCDCDSSPALSANCNRVGYVISTSDSDSVSYLSTLRHDTRDPY